MQYQDKCKNMNHGRLQVPIKFCPDCGEKISATKNASCGEAQHAARRKNRSTFCCDCGKKLRDV